jgi:hypothetical protein
VADGFLSADAMGGSWQFEIIAVLGNGCTFVFSPVSTEECPGNRSSGFFKG